MNREICIILYEYRNFFYIISFNIILIDHCQGHIDVAVSAFTAGIRFHQSVQSGEALTEVCSQGFGVVLSLMIEVKQAEFSLEAFLGAGNAFLRHQNRDDASPGREARPHSFSKGALVNALAVAAALMVGDAHG